MIALTPRTVRLALIAAVALAAIAGAAGITDTAVFHQPGDLKYAVTVVGPLLVLLAASSDHPLEVLVAALILVAPFGAFVMTFSGIHVSALAVLIGASAVAAVVSTPPMTRMSRMGWATLAALALLAVPIVTTSGGHAVATVLAAMVAVAWLVSRTACTDRGLRIVLWAFLASATVQAAIAIWEFKSGHLLNLYGSAGNQVFGTDYFFGFESKNRPVGSFFDPISLGNVLALACPLALALFVSARTILARLLAGAGGIVVAVGLALSLSRESWLGAAAGLLLTMLCLPSATRRSALVPTLGAALIVAVLAIGSTGGVISSRFSSIANPTGAHSSSSQEDLERVEDWDTALSAFAAHPGFGIGFGNLQPLIANRVPDSNSASSAQSTYLQVLAEAGLAGAVALLLVLAALAQDLIAGLRQNRVMVAGVAGSAAALLICWLTDITIRYVSVAAMFAVLFGIIASQARRASAA